MALGNLGVQTGTRAIGEDTASIAKRLIPDGSTVYIVDAGDDAVVSGSNGHGHLDSFSLNSHTRIVLYVVSGGRESIVEVAYDPGSPKPTYKVAIAPRFPNVTTPEELINPETGEAWGMTHDARSVAVNNKQSPRIVNPLIVRTVADVDKVAPGLRARCTHTATE